MNEEQAKKGETRKKSLIKQISEGICGHCRKPRGEHSKKNLLRCLYTSDYNLYRAILKIKELEEKMGKSGNNNKKSIESIESENLNALAMGRTNDV